MTQKHEPTITHATDPDGIEVVHITIANSEEPATITKADFEEFQERGLSLSWTLNAYEDGKAFVKMPASESPGDLINVSRVTARATYKMAVGHRDKNRLNLRRDNLILRPSPWPTRDVPKHMRLSGYRLPGEEWCSYLTRPVATLPSTRGRDEASHVRSETPTGDNSALKATAAPPVAPLPGQRSRLKIAALDWRKPPQVKLKNIQANPTVK